MQQINFTANLDWSEKTMMFFIIEGVKELFCNFWKELKKYCKYVPQIYLGINIKWLIIKE